MCNLGVSQKVRVKSDVIFSGSRSCSVKENEMGTKHDPTAGHALSSQDVIPQDPKAVPPGSVRG